MIKRIGGNSRGFVLISAIIAFSALMIIGFTLLYSTTGQNILVHDDVYNNNALLTAEAGIEQSLQQLNTDDNFGGYTTEQEFFDNQTQGRGVYTTTVEDSPSDP